MPVSRDELQQDPRVQNMINKGRALREEKNELDSKYKNLQLSYNSLIDSNEKVIKLGATRIKSANERANFLIDYSEVATEELKKERSDAWIKAVDEAGLWDLLYQESDSKSKLYADEDKLEYQSTEINRLVMQDVMHDLSELKDAAEQRKSKEEIISIFNSLINNIDNVTECNIGGMSIRPDDNDPAGFIVINDDGTKMYRLTEEELLKHPSIIDFFKKYNALKKEKDNLETEYNELEIKYNTLKDSYDKNLEQINKKVASLTDVADKLTEDIEKENKYHDEYLSNPLLKSGTTEKDILESIENIQKHQDFIARNIQEKRFPVPIDMLNKYKCESLIEVKKYIENQDTINNNDYEYLLNFLDSEFPNVPYIKERINKLGSIGNASQITYEQYISEDMPNQKKTESYDERIARFHQKMDDLNKEETDKNKKQYRSKKVPAPVLPENLNYSFNGKRKSKRPPWFNPPRIR